MYLLAHSKCANPHSGEVMNISYIMTLLNDPRTHITSMNPTLRQQCPNGPESLHQFHAYCPNAPLVILELEVSFSNSTLRSSERYLQE